MTTRQYAIDRVQLNWLGLDLMEGIAQGTSIQETRNAPKWSSKPTGMGGVVRVYNPDKSGTVTITVDQESKVHQQLRLFSNLDDVSRANVGPMMMKDNSTGETIVFVNAWIMTDPDESRGTESATFPWVFGFEKVVKKSAANDLNVVGN